MRELPEFTSEADTQGAVTLALTGPLLVSRIGALDHALRGVSNKVVKIDLSGVTAIDTVGAWVVWRVSHVHDAQITGASAKAERLIEAVGTPKQNVPITPPRQWIFQRVAGTGGEEIA